MCVVHGASENNYGILLPLAREYQMDGLTERIEEYIVRCGQPSVHKLFLAEEFSMLKVKQQCYEFARR